jgi:hypothetical protein
MLPNSMQPLTIGECFNSPGAAEDSDAHPDDRQHLCCALGYESDATDLAFSGRCFMGSTSTLGVNTAAPMAMGAVLHH